VPHGHGLFGSFRAASRDESVGRRDSRSTSRSHARDSLARPPAARRPRCRAGPVGRRRRGAILGVRCRWEGLAGASLGARDRLPRGGVLLGLGDSESRTSPQADTDPHRCARLRRGGRVHGLQSLLLRRGRHGNRGDGLRRYRPGHPRRGARAPARSRVRRRFILRRIHRAGRCRARRLPRRPRRKESRGHGRGERDAAVARCRPPYDGFPQGRRGARVSAERRRPQRSRSARPVTSPSRSGSRPSVTPSAWPSASGWSTETVTGPPT
jgi:hypothetical protein